MRAFACIIAATLAFASPASAKDDRDAAAFWKAVQTRCNATAAKPASALGERIAKGAISEFDRLGGHRVDADGRMFHFGLTEAEHEPEYNGEHKPTLGDLAWWRVIEYWRALYGDDFANYLEVRGYRDASTATEADKPATLIDNDLSVQLRAADAAADPDTREILREAALRAAVIDTPWSAAFVSYVIKQAGVGVQAFHFANAHRVFIYDAFATSAAELKGSASDQIYRACPLSTTRPRVGDFICMQREQALADATEADVRERIRAELAGDPDARTVRKTHCDIVSYVDRPARKMYVIGGNVYNSITVKKLNLSGRGGTFSAVQKRDCGGPGRWTLPAASGKPSPPLTTCSLNDKKWFVLLQLR